MLYTNFTLFKGLGEMKLNTRERERGREGGREGERERERERDLHHESPRGFIRVAVI